MKGITHFLTGVATASCFPLAIQTAFADKSFLMLYGGFCGLLPDTLDFKFARYFWDFDHVVSLTEDNLDAKLAAETVARAIDEAAATGKPVRVKLNVIRISTNYYRTVAVQIDGERKEVTAYVGPLKTMSHVMARGETLPGDAARFRAIAEKGPVAVMGDIAKLSASLPGTIPEPEIAHVAKFKADVNNTYYADTEIGIFSGPDWQFKPQADGKVRIDFIPWHRHWSHSVTLGLLLGPLGLLIFGLSGLLSGFGFINPFSVAALFIGPLAFWSHVFVDQLGHLGSNLYPPWTKVRSLGWKLSTSSSAFGNQMVNFLSAMIILWNINAYGPKAVFTLPWARGMAGDFGTPLYYLVSLLNYATVNTWVSSVPLSTYGQAYRVNLVSNKFSPAVGQLGRAPRRAAAAPAILPSGIEPRMDGRVGIRFPSQPGHAYRVRVWDAGGRLLARKHVAAAGVQSMAEVLDPGQPGLRWVTIDSLGHECGEYFRRVEHRGGRERAASNRMGGRRAAARVGDWGN